MERKKKPEVNHTKINLKRKEKEKNREPRES